MLPEANGSPPPQDKGPANVALIVWPAEAARRDGLAARGQPRLLVVDDGVEPPQMHDCLEDWVRAPAGEQELQARTEALAVRARCHHRVVPVLDEEGFVRFGSHWVHLPPVEARLVGALLERLGAVVGSPRLIRAGWPEGGASRAMLDVRIHRLRRRLAPLGLVIRTVRQRGWILEVLEVNLADGVGPVTDKGQTGVDERSHERRPPETRPL